MNVKACDDLLAKAGDVGGYPYLVRFVIAQKWGVVSKRISVRRLANASPVREFLALASKVACIDVVDGV
jgi:hypothetical protein